jgi:hypothetical protein
LRSLLGEDFRCDARNEALPIRAVDLLVGAERQPARSQQRGGGRGRKSADALLDFSRLKEEQRLAKVLVRRVGDARGECVREGDPLGLGDAPDDAYDLLNEGRGGGVQFPMSISELD